MAERLLAVQAQDPRGFRLAVRARTTGLSAADVDRALTEDRSLVVTWLCRGTLHLVRREDYPWLQALIAPRRLRPTIRRLGQEGIGEAEADRGVEVIRRSLAAEGPLSRKQLGERIVAAGVDTAGQRIIHLLALACLRGLAVRGPVAGGEQAYVLVRDWLGEPGQVDRDAALAELARRYLYGHGPGDDRDLALWAGLPLRDARAGLGAIGSELDRRGDGLVDLANRTAAAQLPPPRLLGAFDPVLLGWVSRDTVLGEHQAAVIAGGVFRPLALVRGRAAATWTMRGGEVSLEPLRPLSRATAAALRKEAADVVRFLVAA